MRRHARRLNFVFSVIARCLIAPVVVRNSSGINYLYLRFFTRSLDMFSCSTLAMKFTLEALFGSNLSSSMSESVKLEAKKKNLFSAQQRWWAGNLTLMPFDVPSPHYVIPHEEQSAYENANEKRNCILEVLFAKKKSFISFAINPDHVSSHPVTA